MTKLVVHGATMKCNHGSKTCALAATSAASVMTGQGPVASQFDSSPGSNVPTFGTCDVDHKKCHPITPLPWSVEWIEAIISPAPAISHDSELRCFKVGGARISIVNAGQATIYLTARAAAFVEFFMRALSNEQGDSSATDLRKLEPVFSELADLIKEQTLDDLHDEVSDPLKTTFEWLLKHAIKQFNNSKSCLTEEESEQLQQLTSLSKAMDLMDALDDAKSTLTDERELVREFADRKANLEKLLVKTAFNLHHLAKAMVDAKDAILGSDDDDSSKPPPCEKPKTAPEAPEGSPKTQALPEPAAVIGATGPVGVPGRVGPTGPVVRVGVVDPVSSDLGPSGLLHYLRDLGVIGDGVATLGTAAWVFAKTAGQSVAPVG